MPRPTLLSGTLRRLTVGVSLVTSVLFALLAAAVLRVSFAWAPLFFLVIFWVHCYVPGYVEYGPTRFGRVRDVVTAPHPVRECVVCGGSDDRGVVREYTTQVVAAGIPLATTESGENEYCERCHAVEVGSPDESVLDGRAGAGSGAASASASESKSPPTSNANAAPETGGESGAGES